MVGASGGHKNGVRIVLIFGSYPCRIRGKLLGILGSRFKPGGGGRGLERRQPLLEGETGRGRGGGNRIF